ncbi:glycosyltransferase [Vibrio mexicanus]|uniref:glycosyltransferase n=1 Tax=Vibrio mexicanus TaxID=1004326 RepID=UPI00063C1E10|nr:glycosyltransferase [Vibrio mexicanus]
MNIETNFESSTFNHNEGRNIIHVVQHLAPGGLESLALDFLAFSDPRDNVAIISLEGEKESAIANWPKLETVRSQILFMEKKPGIQLTLFKDLAQVFSKLKADVVHTHHIGPLLYAGAAARLSNVPHRIHTEHDAWHLNNRKRRWLQSLALSFAKPTLVADANGVHETLKNHFRYSNTITIKNGIDCDKFSPASKALARQLLKLPLDKKVVGCAGRLETVKGHDVAIEAMTLLSDNVHLAIAGSGSQFDQLNALVKEHKLENRVTFLGHVDSMPKFYQSLDVFCMPSRCEGFPLSTLEAQSCDIVTVATDVGASSETLCPLTSLLVDSENYVDLAAAIAKQVDNDTLDSPRRFVLQNNDVRGMVRAYRELTMGEVA